MCHLASSVSERTTVWIVVVIAVAAVFGGVGYAIGHGYPSSPSSTPAAVTNSTLSILAAGTLSTTFSNLANTLVNETPGISAPTAAQTYEGSLDVTTAITSLHAAADVVALADFRLAPQLLEPTYANYEVVFGMTPEVLAYDPGMMVSSGPAFAGINSTNWPALLDRCTTSCQASSGGAFTGVPLGVWNASSDPNGYNEIFSLELQGLLFNSTHTTNVTLNQFYTGGAGGFDIPNPTLTRVEHESQAATLVSTGTVCAVITYRSFAIANHMSFVSFNATVGLNDTSPAALSTYSTLTTLITSSSGARVPVQAAPVLFAVTVPPNAQNPTLGDEFLHLLLSPAGSAVISAGGAFTPIFPGWADHPSAVPGILAPDVTSMPSWASALLPSG
jgi:ABC-type molybdate transport system substrate-binding protein